MRDLETLTPGGRGRDAPSWLPRGDPAHPGETVAATARIFGFRETRCRPTSDALAHVSAYEVQCRAASATEHTAASKSASSAASWRPSHRQHTERTDYRGVTPARPDGR